MLKKYIITIWASFFCTCIAWGSGFKQPVGRLDKIKRNIKVNHFKKAKWHIQEGKNHFSGNGKRGKDPYMAGRHFNHVLENYPYKSLHATARLYLAQIDISKSNMGRAWHYLVSVIDSKEAPEGDKKEATRLFNDLKQPYENYLAYRKYAGF